MDSNIAITVGDELDDEVVLGRQKQQQLQLQHQQNSPQQNMQQPSKVVVESSQIEFFYEKFKQCYPMYKNPRGQCLIVNIYQINGMPPRRWSDRDTDALRQLFEQLLFNVVVYTDSTHDLNCQNFKKIVSDFSKLDEHEEAQCCVVCLMSHGEEGFLTTKEGNKVPLDDIFAMFNNVNCPNLAGKPKLFFIQSCRDDPITGPAEDLGIRLSYTATPTTPSGSSSPSSQLKAGGEETDGGGIRGRFEQTQSDNNQMIGESLLESSLRTTPSLSSEERASCEEEENNGGSPSQVFYHIPSLCDMIIGFPTQKGFIAYRKPEIGSWYMNAIVNVFSRYAHNTDLCAMLNMVNLLISNEVTNTGKKQMSEYTSKLTKPYFYFFPGLASDPCEAPQLKSSESSRKPINNHQTKSESSSTIEPCSKRQCFDYFKPSSLSSFDQTDSSSSSSSTILSYSPSKNWKHVSRELGLGESFIREFARTHKDQSDAEKMNSLKRFLAANNNSKSRFEELSTVLN